MSKIIRAIQNSENALLESPTGTGKTLALLVGVLAWREHEKVELFNQLQEAQKMAVAAAQSGVSEKMEGKPDKSPAAVKSIYFSSTSALEQSNESEPTRIEETLEEPNSINQNDDDDDFQPSLKRRKMPSSKSPPVNANQPSPVLAKRLSSLTEDTSKGTKAKTLPTIYFLTRTQKQIEQVVKELRSNSIYTPRMTILASREHFCVHPTVVKTSNRNEECDVLVRNGSCGYFNGVRKLAFHPSIASGGPKQLWDVEDLVSLGKKVKGCPYYSARTLAESAEVIFAPYNYLIDPLIRESSDINLDGSIVIIDEGHNVEDQAAGAAAFEMEDGELEVVRKELLALSKHTTIKTEAEAFLHVIEAFLHWREAYKGNYTIQEYDRSFKIWSGTHILKVLEEICLYPKSQVFLEACLSEIKEILRLQELRNSRSSVIETDEKDGKEIRLSATCSHILRGLVLILGFVFEHVEDYRLVLIKTAATGKKVKLDNRAENIKISSPFSYKIAFWCMNPAVIFKTISDKCRSVILTSGTLSPMSSFASELGAAFPQRLEAPHVIKPDQVLIGAIPSALDGFRLSGTYKNFESWEYQDRLGALLLEIIRLTPDGLLIFLPSYSWMDKLIERWRSTKLFLSMESYKTVFIEPRGNINGEFDKLMLTYYSTLESKGCVMFCIARGKLSEGIDFSNSRARAVVCVGIPFPNIKDVYISEKKKYNDQPSMNELVSGSQWYSIQAFRAINQAIGRCIRHRNDWGAVLLIDERYCQDSNARHISKWVREWLIRFDHAGAALNHLAAFFAHRQAVAAESEQPIQLKLDSTSPSVKEAMSDPSPAIKEESTNIDLFPPSDISPDAFPPRRDPNVEIDDVEDFPSEFSSEPCDQEDDIDMESAPLSPDISANLPDQLTMNDAAILSAHDTTSSSFMICHLPWTGGFSGVGNIQCSFCDSNVLQQVSITSSVVRSNYLTRLFRDEHSNEGQDPRTFYPVYRVGLNSPTILEGPIHCDWNEFNCYWCIVDQAAYQPLECSCRNSVIGVRVLSQGDLWLFPSSVRVASPHDLL